MPGLITGKKIVGNHRKMMVPPRQGARVGVGMLRGVFLGDLKDLEI